MARPREFEENDAIRKATEVFWTHGYQDASLPDLLTGMGLTRGSLYKAFKDKKHLYLRVLEQYERDAVAGAVRMLTDVEMSDGSARIIALFASIQAVAAQGEERGCLLCTAASGPEMADADIAAAVHRGLFQMQSGFVAALEASPAHATLSETDCLRLAEVLVTQYVGVRVLTRSRLPSGSVSHAAQGVAEILRPH